jgi:hypothetical protein
MDLPRSATAAATMHARMQECKNQLLRYKEAKGDGEKTNGFRTGPTGLAG